jgi:hypothetical protein
MSTELLEVVAANDLNIRARRVKTNGLFCSVLQKPVKDKENPHLMSLPNPGPEELERPQTVI